MASKKSKKKSSISDNKLLALASVALLLISALFLSVIQANRKSLGKTNTGQASNNQSKTSSKAEIIDCTKKLTQEQRSELENLISQGKASPDACLHMGCGNFF